jgi:hypothetical protein
MATINQLVREFEKVCGPQPSRQLTVSNLLNQETGKLNRDVYEALVRREAMHTFGSTAPAISVRPANSTAATLRIRRPLGVRRAAFSSR